MKVIHMACMIYLNDKFVINRPKFKLFLLEIFLVAFKSHLKE